MYAENFQVNGTSLLSKLSAASNAKGIFFNVCSNYSNAVFYGDGVHGDQPTIMAAEAASVANCSNILTSTF